jgi:hypothetical protein
MKKNFFCAPLRNFLFEKEKKIATTHIMSGFLRDYVVAFVLV